MPDQTLHESAVDTAQELRDDLEAIAESDLAFAIDAKQILNALEEHQQNNN